MGTVFAVWLILVLGPCLFSLNIFTLAWMGLMIVGSVYGLRRELKKRSMRMSA
jgi:hypothetical protein